MKYRISDIFNFVETSSCTTIMQAASKLEISQPALSESLKRLETDLGLILFYRSRSGIQLTPSGKNFLDKAHNVIQALNDLELNQDVSTIFANRTIRIGCHTTVAQYCIPQTLRYLKENAPDYKIDLKHDLSRNIQAEIQKGLIDIGIVINPTEVPDIVIQKLAQDTVGIWSAKTNEDFDTVICNLNLFQTQSILKKWKNKPKKVISTDSLELISRLTNEKIGYGILPARAPELYHHNLKMQLALPSYKDDICVVYRPEFGKIAAEKITLEAIKKAFKD